jgi:hypothetical protein
MPACAKLEGTLVEPIWYAEIEGAAHNATGAAMPARKARLKVD